MQIPDDLFTSLQTIIDSGEKPAGITFPIPPVIYRADFDELLKPNARIPAKGGRHPSRPVTPFEMQHLKRSLPILGFPFHRVITQGPYEGQVYSLKWVECLRSLKPRKTGWGDINLYHPAFRCGVRIHIQDVVSGRWPRALNLQVHKVGTEEEVLAELDVLAGGRERWRDMSCVGQPDYAMTDQARVFRYRPMRNGRAQNPRTGEPIPYELVPSAANGQYQIGLPLPCNAEGESAGPGSIRYYLKAQYRLIWGDKAHPKIAANNHSAQPWHPHIDLEDTFRVRRRGRPPAELSFEATPPKTEPEQDPKWDEHSSVSL